MFKQNIKKPTAEMGLVQYQYELAFLYLTGSYRGDRGTLSRRKHSDRARSNRHNLGNSIKFLYYENS